MKRHHIFSLIILLILNVVFYSGCGRKQEQSANPEEPFFPNYHSDYVKSGSLLFYVEENVDQNNRVSYRLRVLDLETGDCMPLCGKPECTHDVETCNARISSGFVRLMLYQDRLYWLDGTEHHTLLSVKLDGTERKEVMQLDRELGREARGLGSAAIHDDVLYICAGGTSIQDGMPVDTVTVFRQSLGSKEGELIYRSSAFSEAFGRVSGDRFLFAVLNESARDDTELCETRLYAYEISTGALFELYGEKEPEVLYNYLLASDTTVYLGGYNRGIAYSLQDGDVQIYDMMNGLYDSVDIGDGYLLYWKNAHDYACRDDAGQLLFEGSFPPDDIDFADEIPIRRYIGYSGGKMYYFITDIGRDGRDDRSYIIEFDLVTQTVKACWRQLDVTYKVSIQ